MAFKFKTKKGKEVTLLNPSEKGRKFAEELRYGVRLTNDFSTKRDKDGNYLGLTDT